MRIFGKKGKKEESGRKPSQEQRMDVLYAEKDIGLGIVRKKMSRRTINVTYVVRGDIWPENGGSKMLEMWGG